MEKSTNIQNKNIIVCIDIGDGECSAFSIKKNSAGLFGSKKPLYLAEDPEEKNRDGEIAVRTRIPSVMYRDDSGEVYIGEMRLGEGYSCVSNFKRSPPFDDGGWDLCCYSATDEKSFREYMFIFIKELWENIVWYNQCAGEAFEHRTLADIQRKQDVAIFVGCPASDNWLADGQKEKYKDMIRAATGINDVYIIPESTASAFSAVMRNKTFKYEDGIAVFDFGSSTADFTYICGDFVKKLSWTLGANSIDKAIYRLLYEDAGYDIADGDFPFKDTKAYREFEIRTNVKEKYFLPYTSEKRTQNVEFYSEELERKFVIEESFMDRALDTRVRTPVKENGKGRMNGRGKGWRELCEDFFLRCKNVLGDSHPVGRIILSGGAGNMYFIEDICREVFKKEPERDISPYNCVSEGLCQVAINHFNVDQILRTEMEILKRDSYGVKYHSEQVTLKIRKFLYEKLKAFINKQPPVKQKYEDLIRMTNRYMANAVNNSKDELLALIKTDLTRIEEHMSDQYRKVAQRCSRTLYGREDFWSGPEFNLYYEAKFKDFYEYDFKNYSFFGPEDEIKDFMNKSEQFLYSLNLSVPEADYPIYPQRFLNKIFKRECNDIMTLMDIPVPPEFIHHDFFEINKDFSRRILRDTVKIIISLSLLDDIFKLDDLQSHAEKIKEELVLKYDTEDDLRDDDDNGYDILRDIKW